MNTKIAHWLPTPEDHYVRAAAKGEFAGMDEALAMGADPNVLDANGKLAIVEAARCSGWTVFHCFKHGASLVATDSTGTDCATAAIGCAGYGALCTLHALGVPLPEHAPEGQPWEAGKENIRRDVLDQSRIEAAVETFNRELVEWTVAQPEVASDVSGLRRALQSIEADGNVTAIAEVLRSAIARPLISC